MVNAIARAMQLFPAYTLEIICAAIEAEYPDATTKQVARIIAEIEGAKR